MELAIEERKKKRKKTLVVLTAVVCGALLIGCLSCLVIGSLAPDESAVPIPVDTPAPVVTPTGASTASPTPRPTRTPHPTYTPIPPGDNTSQYREEMYSLLVRYVEAQETAAELNRQAGHDLLLLRDASWLADIGFAFGQALAIGEKIRELEPEAPPAYREAHSCLVKSTEYYDAFVSLYTQGATDLDASLIAQAAEELGLAAEWMNKATEAMPD